MKKSLLTTFLIFATLSDGFCQDSFFERLADSATTLTRQLVRYDPSYFPMAYPNGDVPADRGVCTDVVIRAFRKMGIDLQKEVHMDIRSNPSAYRGILKNQIPDRNIDHRRVHNLMIFLKRHGTTKDLNVNPSGYLPGDIVCWSLGGAVKHIGIVVKNKSADGQRRLVVHNIGAGQVMEDFLFKRPIIGHYRYGK